MAEMDYKLMEMGSLIEYIFNLQKDAITMTYILQISVFSFY